MTTRGTFRSSVWLALAGVLLASGCGGDSNMQLASNSTPAPTATSVPTATATPRAGNAVAGLAVVRNDVSPNAAELGAPPADWGKPADQESFDRSFANADISVNGTPWNGTTGPDGGFTIPDLPAGRYTIDMTKTVDGNLLPIAVPVVIGDDGKSDVVIEIGMGMVRTTNRYTQGGTDFTEIHAPNGTWMVSTGGVPVELGDSTRTLRDTNRDGHFDTGVCPPAPTACDTTNLACADGSRCQCVSSCPFCDDCRYPGVCSSGGLRSVYLCNADGSCAQPGDRCVDTCPGCASGGQRVCTPSCEPVDITGLTISGPSQIVVGREAQFSATGQLSDGSVIDVTYLVDWQSSVESTAKIDSWGRVSTGQTGTATITAKLGTGIIASFEIEVVARPTLTQITIRNNNCYCGPMFAGATAVGDQMPCYFAAPARPEFLPFPSCTQTLVVGGTLQFSALGLYADNTYEDITGSVTWSVSPATVGDVAKGLFTARTAGAAEVRASLDGVQSDAAEVRVVTEATVESLSIYPGNYAYDALAGGARPADGASAPCFDCAASMTVLRGDTLQIRATAHYDTGEWRDVSDKVTWRSNDPGVATIGANGVMTAVAAGDASIDATLGSVASNALTVRVVNEASVQSISIYQEGTDRVVAKADQRFFHASAGYDIGIVRDVTGEAVWRSSNESVGGFDAPGVFTARSAGFVDVWAELGDKRSASIQVEVFETSELTYCDPNDVNRAVWSDDFNRVLLESDCRSYAQPGLVTLRYTVTETQPHGGIFDPCLDLYVYDGDRKVRTIREEGCGDPFLASAAPGRDEAAVKYQLRAFWDLKDENGTPVAPGTYTIFGRFYLYYDPVVSLTIEVGDGSSTPRPTRTPPTPTSTPTPGSERVAYLSIGNATGNPGGQVTFEVSFKGSGIPVAGLQNDILFGGVAVDSRDDGRPICKAEPSINKPGSAFSFLNSGCTPNTPNCGGMRAVVLSLDDVSPIPDGTVVYRCTSTIPATQQPGTYRLDCQNALGSDPNGAAVAIRCSSGSIQVGANSAPAPDVDGTCYLGASDCSSSSFFPTAQTRCCTAAQAGASAMALSWCSNSDRDAAGRCLACRNPCDGLGN